MNNKYWNYKECKDGKNYQECDICKNMFEIEDDTKGIEVDYFLGNTWQTMRVGVCDDCKDKVIDLADSFIYGIKKLQGRD